LNPTDSFRIKRYTVGYIQTNMYLIIKDKKGIVIDPGFTNFELDIIEKIKAECSEIFSILLTHCHFDHISGAYSLKQAFNCKIYCHRLEEEKLLDPQKSGAIFFGENLKSISVDGYLEDMQKIKFCDLELKIFHTPGHTKGSISILVAQKYLFSGDTIMKGAIGRTDLYDGSYNDEILSIKNKILTLPQDTIIYPGHGPSTTVKEERKYFKI